MKGRKANCIKGGYTLYYLYYVKKMKNKKVIEIDKKCYIGVFLDKKTMDDLK